jgi:hypothetical protein
MELAIIKQALHAFLADHDPKVEKTTFSNALMDFLLPYLKEISPAWESMKSEDLNTQWNAISSMYHSLRGQFRSLTTIRQGVKDYLEELAYLSEQNLDT